MSITPLYVPVFISLRNVFVHFLSTIFLHSRVLNDHSVVALRTQTDFDTECSQKLGLCVLVLLPPDSLPTAGVTQYIEV